MPRIPTGFAHVLYLDLVQSSQLSIEDYAQETTRLRDSVLRTQEYRSFAAAGKAQVEDTGDGLAVAFLEDPLSPAECLIQLIGRLGKESSLCFRAGLHSGPAVRVNGLSKPKLTGAVFADANRVMNACRPGEVLASIDYARILSKFERWASCLGEEESRVTKDSTVAVVSLEVACVSIENPVSHRPPEHRMLQTCLLAVGSFLFGAVVVQLLHPTWIFPRPVMAAVLKQVTFSSTTVRYGAVDLGAVGGYSPTVCLNNLDQIAVGFDHGRHAELIDAKTGSRTDLGRQMYRPQISDTGKLAGFTPKSIIFMDLRSMKFETVLPYEAGHGGVQLDRRGSRVFYFNCPGKEGVACRWSRWEPKSSVFDSINPQIESAYSNDRDMVVGNIASTIVTNYNQTTTPIAWNQILCGISARGEVVLFDPKSHATSVLDYSGTRLETIPDFDPREADAGQQVISDGDDEQLIGKTSHGLALFDLSSRTVHLIKVAGWSIDWIASINQKNEVVAEGRIGNSAPHLLLLKPEN